MKINGFMTMMVAAVAVVLCVCACGSDDDSEAALAEQVIGSYTGEEVITVMNEESSRVTATYGFTKSSDISIDMTIPESESMGNVSIPSLPVKNITLTKSDNSIMGKLSSYAGTVKNSSGEDKAYTISNATVIFKENVAVVTFSLKYGTMPFDMVTTFTGTKK